MDKLTNEMIVALANDLGLEPALLKAVQLVEGAGRDGFLVDGRPQILFDRSYYVQRNQKQVRFRQVSSCSKELPYDLFPKMG